MRPFLHKTIIRKLLVADILYPISEILAFKLYSDSCKNVGYTMMQPRGIIYRADLANKNNYGKCPLDKDRVKMRTQTTYRSKH